MKTTRKILGLFLACAIILGALPSVAVRAADSYMVKPIVKADDPSGLTFEVNGEQAYSVEKEGGEIPDADGVPYANRFTTAEEYEQNTPEEQKYKWRNNVNNWEQIRKVLYFGHPNNAALSNGTKIDASPEDTQAAVWFFTGGGEATNEKISKLIEVATDTTVTVPDTAELQFFTKGAVTDDPHYLSVVSLKMKEDARTPKITTQVKAGDTTGEPIQLLMEDGAKVTKITDSITYSGLLPDATYTAKAELCLFAEDGSRSKVAEATAENLKADAGGAGEWADAVTFNVEGLDPYSKYGVVVVLTSVNNADDQIRADGLKHNEKGDEDKEIILVADYYGNHPFDPLGSPEGGEPAIATTVSAGEQTATSEKAVTLTAETAAKIDTVTDTITYEGMDPNATYEVSGTLMKVTIRSGKTYVSRVATAKETVVANGVGAGNEWVVTFKDVKLQANTTYVVFEEVVDADGEKIAEHKNPKDMAQTIVVSGSSSGNSPKTADRVWPAALLALVLIVAGVMVLGRRRKTDN